MEYINKIIHGDCLDKLKELGLNIKQLNGNIKHPFRFINFPLSNLLYEYILGSDLVELLDSINDSI